MLGLRRLVKLALPFLPVDALLQKESVDASEEQEALSDRFECNSSSCLPNAEGALRDKGDRSVLLFDSLFPSAAVTSVLSAFLKGFEAGFRAVATDLALFPAGTSTGLDSVSVIFNDRIFGGPDI